MTVESNGHSYSFEGFLTSTEISYDTDELNEYDLDNNFRQFIRRPVSGTCTLEISIASPITQEVITNELAKQRIGRNV